MASKTISQRISLEGSEDIRKKLEELGRTGEAAFKKLRESAQQGIIDPAQIDTAKQSLAELGATAEQTGTSLVTAAKAFALATVGIVTAIAAVTTALRSGAGETAIEITKQADALGLTIPQWIGMRRAIDAAGASVEEFVHATGPLLRDLNQLSVEASGKTIQQFGDVTVTVHRQVKTLTQQSGDLLKMLEKLGVRRDIIDQGSVATLTELARNIANIPEKANQAAAGLQFFGSKWRDVVSSLTIGMKSVGDAEAEMDNKRRASRQLTEEQVKSSKEAADQWEDLGKAIRATKDLIGATLAGGSFTKAKWLTDLVDDTRELFKTWQGLDEQKRKVFLAGLGDSGAALAFKTLLAVSETLSTIWNGVLVPAGQKLAAIVFDVANGFGAISKSQVIGFLITAAAAAVTLAVAFKGIALLLTPLTVLAAVFTPLGLSLVAAAAAATIFWDKIKAGADAAAALIPQQMQQMREAIGKLFKGDFAGFWDDFSSAAVSAFQTIATEAQKTPWVKTLVDGVKQIAEDLPGAVVLIAKAFIALGKAATGAADAINFIFGTKLTGTDIAVIAIIGTWMGAFVALGAVIGTISSIIVGLAAIFGGPVTAAILAAAAAAALFATYWPEIKQDALDAGQAIATKWGELKALIDAWVTTPVANAWQWLKDTFNDAVGWVTTKVEEAKALVDAWVTTPVANAWQWLKDTFNDAIGWIEQRWNAIKSAFGFGGGGAGGGSPDVPGNARGGLLGGRGTGTSDSNLAWVSRGEHIMPARAVSQPGVLAFLEALRRSGGNLGDVLDGMGRFASGGLVPRYAAGGLAGGMGHLGTVDLRTDHGSVTLMASGSAVDQLSRLAVTKRMTSTGRKPGFVS